MPSILHFADAHIDIAAQGKRDPETGIPVRVLDFLNALDTIVDTAIARDVDLVIFAGDAYKDRTPVPTFQREWERRMIKLSKAGIETILLIGNHDLSPSFGRAHALQEFETLQIPNFHVISRPQLLYPHDLNDLPVQILALPWISRSNYFASFEDQNISQGELYQEIGAKIEELIQHWLNEVDISIPTILTAHASVQGALLGNERTIMLGNDINLSGSLVKNECFDYVALGHIHKSQNMNEGNHPPVIYPGSIERVDFGEAFDDKYFVISQVNKGKSEVEWIKLEGRNFIDCHLQIETNKDIFGQVKKILGGKEELKDAIVRLVMEYPRDYEALIDEPEIRQYAAEAFEFHLLRRPTIEARLRLPQDYTINEMTDLELLEAYLRSIALDPDEISTIQEISPTFMTENLQA